jgi:hypothetical protein
MDWEYVAVIFSIVVEDKRRSKGRPSGTGSWRSKKSAVVEPDKVRGIKMD